MDFFHYQNDQLFAEQVAVTTLAEKFGTPLYVYSRATLERHWRAFDRALEGHPHLICYAVKANSNLAVLNVLAKLGSGFDIVSVGELERVLAAGGDPAKTVFSGVGKLDKEIERALAVGIACFNVESEAELLRINQLAGTMGKKAPISIRVNPDIDAKTHPYIATGLKENKFGVNVELAKALYQQAADLEHVRIRGIDCHIGSQLLELQPFLEALSCLLSLREALASMGITVKHLDLGGGLGVPYTQESPPQPAEHAAALIAKIQDPTLEVILEPGRAIAANAGILLTQVQYLKHTPTHQFAVVDAGMNDLLRPALYQAEHQVIPVAPRHNEAPHVYDVVGPVCESGDFLAKHCQLSICVGDLLAVRTAGAYGFVMSSQYNSRPRAAEVMVDGDQAFVVRRRERIEDLFALENLAPI